MYTMSGSAGLAAAKRRRAVGSGDHAPPPPGSGRVCRKNARTGVVSCGPAQGGRGGSPHPFVAHLKHHEGRLRQLEAMMEGGDVGGISEEAVAEQLQSVAGAAFEEMAGRLNALEVAVSKAGSPEATDLVYFRNKTEEIETGVADLKRLLLKVQSFAMETNCSLMKLQARVDKQEANAGSVSSGPQEAWETSMEKRIDAAVQRKLDQLATAQQAAASAAGDAEEEEEEEDSEAEAEEVEEEAEEEGNVEVVSSA